MRIPKFAYFFIFLASLFISHNAVSQVISAEGDLEFSGDSATITVKIKKPGLAAEVTDEQKRMLVQIYVPKSSAQPIYPAGTGVEETDSAWNNELQIEFQNVTVTEEPESAAAGSQLVKVMNYEILLSRGPTGQGSPLARLLESHGPVEVRAEFKPDVPEIRPFSDELTATTAVLRQTKAVPVEASLPPGLNPKYRSLEVVLVNSSQKVAFSDGTPREVKGIQLYVLELDAAATIDLSSAARTITYGDNNLDVTEGGECTLDPALVDGGNCITCQDLGPQRHAFLDGDAFSQLPGAQHTPTNPGTGIVQLSDLDTDKRYVVWTAYDKGDGFSACGVAQPGDDISLLEINGEDEAKAEDVRCFVATAAFGSPMHPHVDVLRWVRDHLLLHLPFGEQVIATYYRLSPPLADWIASSEDLRLGSQILLWPAVGAAYAAKTVVNQPIGVMLLLLACLGLGWRWRSVLRR